MLRKYKSLYSSTTNTFSTGESVTITPASVVGLPTDTEITLTFDRVDGSGTKTPDKMERIRGTIVGSNFVVSSGGRAVEGTEQVHTSPVVEMIWNADDWNDSVDWGLVEHGQDGKHSSALVTTLKATGAVVNTGTSDDTIVTPKALADSDYAKTTDITVTEDSTTTFTNKRINPRVVTAASYTTDTGTALDVSTCDEFDVTAQAGALKLNNPGGTPVNGQKLIVRIKDNGTARALTYDTQFRSLNGITLPTTTVISETLYMEFIYNSADTKWDIVRKTEPVVSSALSSKVIAFTRDMTASAGDVSYTGVGFQPSAIIAFSSINGGFPMSLGMVASDKSDGNLTQYGANTIAVTDNFLEINTSAGTYQRAIIKTYDADGFTLTWAKNGSPTGTANIIVLCLK